MYYRSLEMLIQVDIIKLLEPTVILYKIYLLVQNMSEERIYT